MTPADLLEDQTLALQLHGVLSDIDPARWKNEMAQALRRRLTEISARLAERQRLRTMGLALQGELPHLDAPPGELRSRWLAFKERVLPAYAAMAARLSAERIHLPSLRPTNYTRSLFHVTSAAVAVVIIELTKNPLAIFFVALAWGLSAWTAETLRRVSPGVNARLMRLFGPVAHPHETHRVNSSTWYATALVFLSATQSLVLCALGVAVLGLGDPAAAWVGRRYGRIKLMHGRSLEGSLAFVAVAMVACFAVLLGFHGAMSLSAMAVVAASAAVAGALAELVSKRLDDNFTIPVSAAAGAVLALWALHLPL
jgi:dolichol kinase